INYMVAMKNRGINVRVSNNSWGGGGFSKALQTAIQSAKDAGIIFAAAAGNEGNDNDARPSYPASYDIGNVVSVAATDSNGNLAWFSNYGANAVDIAAPGVDIYSTLPNNQYASLSGTSMATPHVAGALGLLLGSEPGLSMDAAITRLYDTGSPLPTLTGAIRTGRLLNLEGLLKNQGTPLPAPTPVPASCSYGVADAPFAPDTRADGTAPILENVDELNFQTVSLPFGFPFDGVQYSRVILSPNGVAYFGSAPDSMDYQNGPRAPLNSIAAPHTDFRLNTLQVAVGENYATIVWRGSLWSFKNGEVIARLTINADGTIYSTIETSNSGIEAALQQASTVGLMGRERNNFVTYSYNSKKVHDKMAVLYTPNCGGSSPVKVKDMALQGHDGSSSVQAGRKFSVNARTSKSGTSTSANLVLALDGARCEPISVNLKPGSTRITGILPDKAKYFNRFRANLGNVSASAPIESSASRSRARKISKSERTKICNQIAGRLKSR
ncbi:MAG: hypothetical protein DCC75_09115, partial [Proteobacteria bacterium]